MRTVRIVPSWGSANASRAYLAPNCIALAKDSGVILSTPAAPSLSPWKNWANITPEFPRAPSRAASATSASISSTRGCTFCAVLSIIDVSVKAILVPVSPSGTGNTLILLRYSCLESTLFAPATKARCNRVPSK